LGGYFILFITLKFIHWSLAMKKILIFAFSCFLAAGVIAQTTRPLTDENGWLFSSNDPDERFARIAKHFRGYDNAMLEVGQRFQTVYDAQIQHPSDAGGGDYPLPM
jgi:hypothetical protein